MIYHHHHVSLCLCVQDDNPTGEPQKLGFLREAISRLLLTLLAEPTDDRIKTAAQLLKVSAHSLYCSVFARSLDTSLALSLRLLAQASC